MSLFWNKVAGLQPQTSFKKDSCTGVFLWNLPNILEHLFCKTRPGDCFCKISFCLSRQPRPPNVTIKLVFLRFTLTIVRANTCECPRQLSYEWTDLLLIKQAINWKCYRKSEAVAQQCSVKMSFCKTSQFSKKSVCDGVSFGKVVSPHVCNCTKKDVFTVVFLWTD